MTKVKMSLDLSVEIHNLCDEIHSSNETNVICTEHLRSEIHDLTEVVNKHITSHVEIEKEMEILKDENKRLKIEIDRLREYFSQICGM